MQLSSGQHELAVSALKVDLQETFADRPLDNSDVNAVRVYARSFMRAYVSLSDNVGIYRSLIVLQTAYGRIATHRDLEVEEMVRVSVELVESCNEEGWLSFAHVLMPNIAAMVLERRRVEEERRIEEEERQYRAEQDRRRELERRAFQREAERASREAAAQRLSPTSSRTAARKTSTSSLGGGDVEWNSEASMGMGTRTRSVSRGRGRGLGGKSTRSMQVEAPKSSQVATPKSSQVATPKASKVAKPEFREPKFVVPCNSDVVSSL